MWSKWHENKLCRRLLLKPEERKDAENVKNVKNVEGCENAEVKLILHHSYVLVYLSLPLLPER